MKRLLALALVVLSAFGEAAEVMQVSNIRSVLNEPKNEERVILRGRIAERIDDKRFVLNDGTGRIHFELDRRFQGQAPALGMNVQIEGTVMKRIMGDPAIRVERVTILKEELLGKL